MTHSKIFSNADCTHYTGWPLIRDINRKIRLPYIIPILIYYYNHMKFISQVSQHNILHRSFQNFHECNLEGSLHKIVDCCEMINEETGKHAFRLTRDIFLSDSTIKDCRR